MARSNLTLVTNDLTLLTPAAIDTALSGLWKTEQDARRHAAEYRRWATRASNSFCNADYLTHAAKEDAIAVAARDEAKPYVDEFSRRGGWNRYFLVTNASGHVHRGTCCNTCFVTTQYAWLIELADCDEAAMIEEFGEKACTVCFPSAPANPAFHAPGRRDAIAQAERAAEKAARAAEKATKAITAPDGSVLRVGGDTLLTKVAAQRALSSAVNSFGWYGPTHPFDFLLQARTLIAALEAIGIATAPIIERAAKKIAKEGGSHDIRPALGNVGV